MKPLKLLELLLYTVHTPVPAGHDYFDEGLFGKYMGGYPQKMGISWDELMNMGRNNPGDKNERFCMSVLLVILPKKLME